MMCGPGVEPPWVWAWYAGIPVASGLVWLAVRRARRGRSAPRLPVRAYGDR